VLSTVVGTGAVQRSTVGSIGVTFNAPVDLNAGSFTLYQEVLNANGTINTGASPVNVTADVTAVQSADARTLTLSVTPGGALDRSGADDAGFFANGIYQLVLNGSAITDTSSTIDFHSGASSPADLRLTSMFCTAI